MSQITLLDGGMGQELLARSGDQPTPLWATQVMIDHPGMVQSIHADYFAAGATIATTNTYAIHRDRLDRYGDPEQFDVLIDAAMSEADAARTAHGLGRVAGAIGPLVASYRPETHPEHDVAVPLYRELAERMAAKVDLILCETVASLAHADAILDGASISGKPVWLAVTVDDEDGRLLRSGEPVTDLLPLSDGRAAALLANCSAPEAMAAALDGFGKGALPFGAYANGFTQITKAFLEDAPTADTLHPRAELTPELYADFAMGWVDQGATLIGGCCEVGPAHIKEIATRLQDAGHEIV